MVDTFHPEVVFTSTWFIRKREGCARPAGEIIKVMDVELRDTRLWFCFDVGASGL